MYIYREREHTMYLYMYSPSQKYSYILKPNNFLKIGPSYLKFLERLQKLVH